MPELPAWTGAAHAEPAGSPSPSPGRTSDWRAFTFDQPDWLAAELAKPAIAAVEKGDTAFVPKNWEKTYYEWMRNIQPWCISRQLWWGHRIPAWYGESGQVFVARDGQAYAAREIRLGRIGDEDAEVLAGLRTQIEARFHYRPRPDAIRINRSTKETTMLKKPLAIAAIAIIVSPMGSEPVRKRRNASAATASPKMSKSTADQRAAYDRGCASR